MEKMVSRPLGRSGMRVFPIGLGCMGMSEFYGETDDEASLATLRRALDLGVDHLDTADMYGSGHNEELLGRFLRGLSARPRVATKFGVVREAGDGKEYRRAICGRPEYVQQACERSLRRLGVDTIDLYYCHRVDPQVPIEDTVGAMKGLVERGLVRAIGLSEASAATIRRAHAVHPIAAVQSEYSLFSRDVEKDVLPACRELGITFVAYSPLGRGVLTGALRTAADFAEGDVRRLYPRFQGENLARNATLADTVTAVAAAKGRTASQIALAWVLSRGDDVLAIPGTKRTKYLEENLGASGVTLDAGEVARLESALAPERVAGDRYPAEGMKLVNR